MDHFCELVGMELVHDYCVPSEIPVSENLATLKYVYELGKSL